VEATVQTLLGIADEGTPVKFRPRDDSKEIQCLKLGKACGLDGIPNVCLRRLPRRPLVRLTHIITAFGLVTLPKPGKDSKFPPNLCPISLLSTTGKVFEKLILRTIEKHIEERNLLNTSLFGFQAGHSTIIQCMRLTDHITLNFNNNMSTAAVFLDIEEAFDTTWHSGLLYRLSELAFREVSLS
jgi:hypothetical protein